MAEVANPFLIGCELPAGRVWLAKDLANFHVAKRGHAGCRQCGNAWHGKLVGRTSLFDRKSKLEMWNAGNL